MTAPKPSPPLTPDEQIEQAAREAFRARGDHEAIKNRPALAARLGAALAAQKAREASGRGDRLSGDPPP